MMKINQNGYHFVIKMINIYIIIDHLKNIVLYKNIYNKLLNGNILIINSRIKYKYI